MNERTNGNKERTCVCLHPLGFKDSTKNTHVFCVSPKNGKEFFLHTRVSLSLQKEDSRLCDVNDDAYFKDEEDEDKEEEDTSKSASSIFR